MSGEELFSCVHGRLQTTACGACNRCDHLITKTSELYCGTCHVPVEGAVRVYVDAPKSQIGAVKHDVDKNRLELIPAAALCAVGEVFTFGAQKYGAENYRKGMKWSRLLGALLRHTFAWAGGEDFDKESGYRHLAHMGCCVLMLIDASINQLGEDDRWKKP